MKTLVILVSLGLGMTFGGALTMQQRPGAVVSVALDSTLTRWRPVQIIPENAPKFFVFAWRDSLQRTIAAAKIEWFCPSPDSSSWRHS